MDVGMCVSFILAPFCPSFSLPFHRFFLYMCALADGAQCALVRRPRPSGSSCLTLVTATAAGGAGSTSCKRNPHLSSNNSALLHSVHCQYFKKKTTSYNSINNLWCISTFRGGSCPLWSVKLVPQKPVANINLPLSDTLVLFA